MRGALCLNPAELCLNPAELCLKPRGRLSAPDHHSSLRRPLAMKNGTPHDVIPRADEPRVVFSTLPEIATVILRCFALLCVHAGVASAKAATHTRASERSP